MNTHLLIDLSELDSGGVVTTQGTSIRFVPREVLSRVRRACHELWRLGLARPWLHQSGVMYEIDLRGTPES